MILMRFVFATLSIGLIWTTRSSAQSYAIGADLSFLKMAEDQGFQFKEEGNVLPVITVFDRYTRH